MTIVACLKCHYPMYPKLTPLDRFLPVEKISE